jgi:hypothetical protein
MIQSHLIQVKSNVLKIPERLREIDKGYFVMWNTNTQQFEVHHKEHIGNTLALNIPFNELDQRTIDLVRQTRIESGRTLIEEMDRNNNKIELQSEKKLSDYIQSTAKDIHKYCSSKASIDIIPDNAYTTRFI